MPVDTTPSSLIELVDHVGRAIVQVFTNRTEESPLPAELGHRELAAMFSEDLPRTGMPVEQVLQIIQEQIIPASLNLTNPMAFGLMTPHPLPLPAVLDGLISTLNQNLGCAWRTAPSGIEVELQTLRWLCELSGLPEDSGGHFTTGGTASNLTAIRLALHHAFPEARAKGMMSVKAQPVLYVSDQGHFSIDRAAGVLGLGERYVRKVRTRSDLTMDVDHLAAQIQEDRKAGLLPFLVVGTAGTTANGTVDPLEALSGLCAAEDLWFHVDAAYGGALMLSDRLKPHLRGIERADSITLDPHKWMFVPFATGALLTRHRQLLRSAFGHDTAYLGREHLPEVESTPSGFYEVSLDGSRRFNGLKLWAVLKNLGVSGLGEMIERQVDLAQILYEQLAANGDVELAPRSPTNIVCFRWAPPRMDEPTRNGLQMRFQQELEKIASCWLSNVEIQGKCFLRVNLLHYHLGPEHTQRLLHGIDVVLRSGPTIRSSSQKTKNGASMP